MVCCYVFSCLQVGWKDSDQVERGCVADEEPCFLPSVDLLSERT